MHVLLILNDPPYGTERTYNGLRLALALLRRPEPRVTVFLMGDAVGAARRDQKTPDGHQNVERMQKRVAVAPRGVLLCGSCMDARGWARPTSSGARRGAAWRSWPRRPLRPTGSSCSEQAGRTRRSRTRHRTA